MTVELVRKSPRSRTIGVNVDGKGAGHLSKISGGTRDGQWAAFANATMQPHCGWANTPEAAAQLIVDALEVR